MIHDTARNTESGRHRTPVMAGTYTLHEGQLTDQATGDEVTIRRTDQGETVSYETKKAGHHLSTVEFGDPPNLRTAGTTGWQTSGSGPYESRRFERESPSQSASESSLARRRVTHLEEVAQARQQIGDPVAFMRRMVDETLGSEGLEEIAAYIEEEIGLEGDAPNSNEQ